MLNALFQERYAAPRVNHSLSMTTAVILTALAAAATLSRQVVVPLHEDVVFVTQVTRSLLHDGNLRNSGLCYPFQVLRPGFHSTQPFFAPYVIAVFYFAPFFQLWGATDAAFFIGQAVLLLLLGAVIARSGMGWRWSLLTISAGVLAGTLVGSICFSPTQLLAICLMAYFWSRPDNASAPRDVWDGLLLGVSVYCRPEAVFMGILASVRNAGRFLDSKKRIRAIGLTAGAALSAIVAIEVCRRLLGAAKGADSALVMLVADVLAPGFRVLGLSHIPSAAGVLHDPAILSGFCHKWIRNLMATVGPSSWLWDRRDWELLILPFFFVAARLSRFRNYAPAFLLLIFQIVLNAVLLPMPRHFDAAFFFVLWALAGDVKRWSERLAPNFRPLFQTTALVAGGLVLAGPLGTLAQGIRGGLKARSEMLAASEEAHRQVPQDAFVITDLPELWIWYGRGKMCCLVPLHNPETMRLVLRKFPRSYMVMFLGDGRAGYPLAQFQRPLLSSAQHVMIYGPAITEPRVPVPS